MIRFGWAERPVLLPSCDHRRERESDRSTSSKRIAAIDASGRRWLARGALAGAVDVRGANELYGGITDEIFVLDTDWRFTHLNDRVEELLNRVEAELIGENVWEFSEAVATTFQDEYENAMSQRVPVAFEGHCLD